MKIQIVEVMYSKNKMTIQNSYKQKSDSSLFSQSVLNC